MTKSEILARIVNPAEWTDDFFKEIDPDFKKYRDDIRRVLDPAGLWARFDKDYSEWAKDAEARADYLTSCAAAHMQEFIDGVTDSVNTPVIPTGFEKFDEMLDGGLYEGLYCIGALSSNGKTTFCLQIADNIAAAGHDVLIVSLEMARSELMAKSISRNTALYAQAHGISVSNAKTVRGITDGRRYKGDGKRYEGYSNVELNLIKQAEIAYSKYADHLFIHESIGEIGAVQVRKLVEQHVKYTEHTPVVLVDYLQILQPYDPHFTDKANTDKAVLELKRISRDFKTPVIAISAFNRQNYGAEVNMAAFRESSAIEYSSDVLLGLQNAGAGEKKNFNENNARKKNPRDVEIVVLKNRNGKTGDKIQFDYFSLFNLFKEK